MESEIDKLIQAKDALLQTLGHPGQLDSLEGPSTIASQAIPVVVLCGFLGAGKTTLLRELLEEADREILAIVNDIASVNIDGPLIRKKNTETIELENGCACCVLGSDLSDHLTSVRGRKDPPDAVVVEASGLSDPYGFMQTIVNQPGFELDGVVAVVDAMTLSRYARESTTKSILVRQLDSAHLIAVTKTECGFDCEGVRQQLGRLAPGRPVVFTDDMPQGRASFLFGSSMMGAHLPVEAIPHDYQGFRSEVLHFDGSMLDTSFFKLLDEVPDTVYRIKGSARLLSGKSEKNSSVTYEVQSVGRHWRCNEIKSESLDSGLVVIGKTGEPSFLSFLRDLQFSV